MCLSVILIHTHLPCHLAWTEMSWDYLYYLRFYALQLNPPKESCCYMIFFLVFLIILGEFVIETVLERRFQGIRGTKKPWKEAFDGNVI